MAEWQIVPLGASHQRGEFSCGKAPLDEFLRTLVRQYEKRRLGRTFVAVRPGEDRVYGYYTLASGAIPFEHLPPTSAKKFPRHPVPVALLGRLAVDRAAQRQGLGQTLLMDALRRCLALSQQLGIFAVEVLALDESAKGFYVRYGFEVLQDNALHLFLPMKTVEAVFPGG
jgi:ribosomal protein S18 acetylase RimI-like enzyme